ncbi:MAG: ATP-binding cassette domain-containing protein [Bacteroides sp.]|nr:ATP-binding cassette domain-containing protein [Roseburia sp.]MCM1345853.1 ATP-binding cassette domain-containing protein [Bacteroides sp.]MCM1420243.1 ATP-binding cassette domain-containing protein [Bacteroides sp.]
MLIEYKNVDIFQESLQVLENVSFTTGEGEFVYIIGKVGSGKSTLLKTVYGELPVGGGEAKVLDYDLCKLKRKHLPELRRRLGIIFQDFQLLTDRNVEENLYFVLKATGWKHKHEMKQRIQEVLDMVGMGTKGYKLPCELSGGEQQRIAIARAILNNPQLILADEPTGNLDKETSMQITELLHDICRKGSAVMMITHNLNLVRDYPGRIFRCEEKCIREVTREEVFNEGAE